MTKSTFAVRQRGIKVFAEGNRLDFLLEDPEAAVQRATVLYAAMDAEHKLDGKKLSVVPSEFDEDGNPKHPNRLTIKWGRNVLNLGWVQPKNNGKPYFYRSLKTANEAARPKTPAEIFAAMGWGK